MATTAEWILEIVKSCSPTEDVTMGSIIEKLTVSTPATIKRTINRMVSDGRLDMYPLEGEPNIYMIPNIKLPSFEDILKYAIMYEPDFGKYLNVKDGGYNTGGGYKYLFRKFYQVLSEMQSQ